jgi:hypothetical protein
VGLAGHEQGQGPVGGEGGERGVQQAHLPGEEDGGGLVEEIL